MFSICSAADCLLCLNVDAPLLRVITAVVGPRAPRLALCRGGGGLPLAIDLLPRPAPAPAPAPPPGVGQQHRGGAHHRVRGFWSSLLSSNYYLVCCLLSSLLVLWPWIFANCPLWARRPMSSLQLCRHSEHRLTFYCLTKCYHVDMYYLLFLFIFV